MKLRNIRDREDRTGSAMWSSPAHYCANRGEAIAQWRLTWQVDPQDWHPKGFDGHMETWFYTEADFNDYYETLLAAQKEGMCRNVAVFAREVTVGPWLEVEQ